MDEKSRIEERERKLEAINEKFNRELEEYKNRFKQVFENTELDDFEKLYQLISLYSKIEELSNFCVFLNQRRLDLLIQVLSEEAKLEIAEQIKKLKDDRRDNHGFGK